MARAKKAVEASLGERVVIGNNRAITGITYPNGETRYERVEGSQQTTLMFPPGLDIEDMVREAIGAMSLHMESGAKPEWIEADNADLLDALMTFYEMTEDKEPTDG